jgi:hypothetical protein
MKAKRTPTIGKIILSIIRSAHADGLCNPELECGCQVGDLVPCGSDPTGCRIGWKRTCAGCGDTFMVADPHCEDDRCPVCCEY